jgi:Ca2+-binding EF-hand superfamily protein
LYCSFHDLKEVADALALEHGNKQNAFSSQAFRHLSDMLCQVTTDNDEDLELDEDAFIRLMSERHYDDDRDEYQRAFDLFDTKGKGHINIMDLRKVSEELGESMADEELEEMISKAAPENGKVTPEDFQRIMTKRLFSG